MTVTLGAFEIIAICFGLLGLAFGVYGLVRLTISKAQRHAPVNDAKERETPRLQPPPSHTSEPPFPIRDTADDARRVIRRIRGRLGTLEDHVPERSHGDAFSGAFSVRITTEDRDTRPDTHRPPPKKDVQTPKEATRFDRILDEDS